MNDKQRYTNEAIDEACKALRELAYEHGVECIEVHVRHDGRVRIYAQTDKVTEWTVDADVLPGGALQYPSAALCDRAGQHKGISLSGEDESK